MPMNLANRLGHITGMLLVNNLSRTGRRRRGLRRAPHAAKSPHQALPRRDPSVPTPAGSSSSNTTISSGISNAIFMPPTDHPLLSIGLLPDQTTAHPTRPKQTPRSPPTPPGPTGPKNHAQGRREAKALGSHDCKSPRPNGAREHTPRTPSPPPPSENPGKKPGNSR